MEEVEEWEEVEEEADEGRVEEEGCGEEQSMVAGGAQHRVAKSVQVAARCKVKCLV